MIKKKKIKRKVKKMKVPQNLVLSYKNVDTLARYITEQGSIISRKESGLSQKQQRHLATEIKRARHLALLPFTQTL